MITCIENLPVELWMSILAYVEAHDLFRAFTNLNHYFDQLVASDYLLFNVRLGKSDINPLQYSIKPYWSDSILSRIISLQPIVQHQTSHIPEFLRWHWDKLRQLKSVTIKLRGREIPTICITLPQLISLRYLALECVPNQKLFEAILDSPALRVCRLDLQRSVTPIYCYSNNTSNIEILYMKLQHDSNNSITELLLSHMPNLKRLEMNSREIYLHKQDSPFVEPLFLLPELRTIKINWSLVYSTSKFFESLHRMMPVLKRFYLNMNYDDMNESFFDHLIYHWWPILRKIEQVNIFIKCEKFLLSMNDNQSLNLDKFQSILLAMNEQYDGLVRAEWIERFYLISKTVEVSICKSC